MTIYFQAPKFLGLVVACTLLLAGCTTTSNGLSSRSKEDARRAAELALQAKREKALNEAWQGKPYDELRTHFGEPPLLMNILGARPLRTSLVVYTKNTNEAHCTDAFTMVKIESRQEWVVADYFCR